jgi:hypothetical protein
MLSSMAIIHFTPEERRNPFDSRIMKCRIEPTLDCDGIPCGLYNPLDESANIDPHFHLVVWGEEPKTTERCFPFFGKLPDIAQFVGPSGSPPTI